MLDHRHLLPQAPVGLRCNKLLRSLVLRHLLSGPALAVPNRRMNHRKVLEQDGHERVEPRMASRDVERGHPRIALPPLGERQRKLEVVAPGDHAHGGFNVFRVLEDLVEPAVACIGAVFGEDVADAQRKEAPHPGVEQNVSSISEPVARGSLHKGELLLRVLKRHREHAAEHHVLAVGQVGVVVVAPHRAFDGTNEPRFVAREQTADESHEAPKERGVLEAGPLAKLAFGTVVQQAAHVQRGHQAARMLPLHGDELVDVWNRRRQRC